jgi:hypothetical protein
VPSGRSKRSKRSTIQLRVQLACAPGSQRRGWLRRAPSPSRGVAARGGSSASTSVGLGTITAVAGRSPARVRRVRN